MCKHLRALLTVATLITVFGSAVVAESQHPEDTEIENTVLLDQNETDQIDENNEPEIEDDAEGDLD